MAPGRLLFTTRDSIARPYCGELVAGLLEYAGLCSMGGPAARANRREARGQNKERAPGDPGARDEREGP